MPEAQKPRCVAMVLCDAVHRDPGNGKFMLLGTFTRINSRQIPINAQFCVYFALTDCIGKSSIGIRIVDCDAYMGDDSESGLPSVTAELTSTDPLETIESVLGFQMVFLNPGVYRCELFSVQDDEEIMSRRFVVTAPEPKEHPNE